MSGYVCILCKHPTEQDDALLPRPDGKCICLSCWERETDSAKPVPKPLRQDVQRTLKEVDS